MFSYTEEVKAGAEWLDSIMPDWFRKIDINKLDMSRSDQCILGQLELKPRFDREVYGLELKVHDWRELHWKFGFTVKEGVDDRGIPEQVVDYAFKVCKDAWLEEIKQRKECNPQYEYIIPITFYVETKLKVKAACRLDAIEAAYEMDLPDKKDWEYKDDTFKIIDSLIQEI